MLKVVILGSGTCVPSKRRGSPGIAVCSGRDWILIDSGSGTLYRMAVAGIDYKSLNYLLYTHIHPDHTVDLAPFLFALNYTPDYNRKNGLEIIGPAGFRSFYEKLRIVYPWISPGGYPLNIVEADNSIFSYDEVQIQTIRVEHGDLPSVAYRITNGYETAVFSGDTGFCDGIVQLSRNSDLLILESSFPSEDKSFGNHLTAGQAGKIAEMAGVNNLVLTHFYPDCDNSDMKSICAGEYNGNIIISEDYMEIVMSEGNIELT